MPPNAPRSAVSRRAIGRRRRHRERRAAPYRDRVGALCAAFRARGQQATATARVTPNGSVDQYLNYMHGSSGATFKSLEAGAQPAVAD